MTREQLIKRMRLLEQDHKPDGYPAVQMRDISALLDMLESDRVPLTEDAIHSLYETEIAGIQLLDVPCVQVRFARALERAHNIASSAQPVTN